MKRIVVIILVLCLILSIAACGGKADEETDRESAATDGESEYTRTLTVCLTENDYTYCYNNFFMSFNREYTEVKVEFDILPNAGDEDYDTALERTRTKLMSGKGADLYIINTKTGLLGDVNLSMGNGVFCDMLPLLEDAGVNMDDFVQPVIKAGQIDGKQYVMPLGYNLLLTLTNDKTDSILGENSFDNLEETMDGLIKLSQIDGVGTRTATAGMVKLCHSKELPMLLAPYYFSETPLVDYKDNSAHMDSAFVRDFLVKGKEFADSFITDEMNEDYSITLEEWEEYVQTDKYFLINDRLSMLLCELGTNEKLGYISNINAVPTSDGGVCAKIERLVAISEASGNKTDAANAVAMMLSREFQESVYDINADCRRFPVRKGCIEGYAGNIVAEGKPPLCSNFYGQLMFSDTLSEEVINRLCEIEEKVSCAVFAVPDDLIKPIESYYNGETDVDTLIETLQNAWEMSLWTAN